jgi:hypothetical protein
MVLAVDSDASYLSEPKARSRAGGHFYMSSETDERPRNGVILNISKIIAAVMSSSGCRIRGVIHQCLRGGIDSKYIT